MNWSLSKYGMHKKCPAQYKYAHIDRLPRPKSDSAQRGIDIHADIERYIKEGKPLPQPLTHYSAWIDALKRQDHQAEWQVALGEGWTPLPWDAPEVWWKGVLDLKVIAGIQGWVFDWKSGKMYPDHDDQKEIYSIATFIHHPELVEIKAVHVYVDLGKNTEKTYSRDQLDWLIRKWNVKISPMMNDKEFIPTPNYGCRWCPYSKAARGPCQF